MTVRGTPEAGFGLIKGRSHLVKPNRSKSITLSETFRGFDSEPTGVAFYHPNPEKIEMFKFYGIYRSDITVFEGDAINRGPDGKGIVTRPNSFIKRALGIRTRYTYEPTPRAELSKWNSKTITLADLHRFNPHS